MIRTLNIAHRGASSLAPENTFAAFDLALKNGADGFELDVQLSKDGIPVIIHDEILERTTTGQGPVQNFTAAELKTLDAGSWFAPEYSGQSIPALEEFFIRYRGENLLFNLELKNYTVVQPGLEEAVLAVILKFGLEEKVIISSFNHDSLTVCHRLNPAVRTGLLYVLDIEEPWHYARALGCSSVHPLFFHLQFPELLSGFKAHHFPLYPWTVNDPELMKFFVEKEIEGIITDYPQELKKILAAIV